MKTPEPTPINALAQRVHAANIKWWQNLDTQAPIERNSLELLALAISELAEALEGERKDLQDDKLPNRKMAEVEMADFKIRLLDFSAGFQIEIPELVVGQKASQVAENKGEAIFEMMRLTAGIPAASNTGFAIAVVIRRAEAYCERFGYDINGAFEEKMAFNATREDHTHEARKIAGGKGF